jgi:hypothetical protein
MCSVRCNLAFLIFNFNRRPLLPAATVGDSTGRLQVRAWHRNLSAWRGDNRGLGAPRQVAAERQHHNTIAVKDSLTCPRGAEIIVVLALRDKLPRQHHNTIAVEDSLTCPRSAEIIVVLALRDKLPRSVNTTIPLRSKTAFADARICMPSLLRKHILGKHRLHFDGAA